jgi:hypothetical protein
MHSLDDLEMDSLANEGLVQVPYGFREFTAGNASPYNTANSNESIPVDDWTLGQVCNLISPIYGEADGQTTVAMDLRCSRRNSMSTHYLTSSHTSTIDEARAFLADTRRNSCYN